MNIRRVAAVRGARGLSLGLLGALLVSGCGGSGSHSATPQSSSSPSAAAANSTAAPNASSAAATVGPQGSAAPSSVSPVGADNTQPQPGVGTSTCRPNQISASASLQRVNDPSGPPVMRGAMTIRNTSSQSCTMSGWPSVQAVDDSRRPVAGITTQTAGGPPPSVTLQPGQSASAALSFVTGAADVCPTISQLLVGLPGQLPSITAALNSSGPAAVCRPTIQAEPFRAA